MVTTIPPEAGGSWRERTQPPILPEAMDFARMAESAIQVDASVAVANRIRQVRSAIPPKLDPVTVTDWEPVMAKFVGAAGTEVEK